MGRDLRESLKRAAAELDAVVPPSSLDARVRARVQEPELTRWVLIGVAAVAVASLVAFAVWPRPPDTLGGFALVSPTRGFHGTADAQGLIHIDSGGAQLVDAVEGQTLSVAAPIELRREPPGARIVRGTVELSIAHRAAGQPPLKISVSHGAIEVLGTRFTVAQDEDGGRVTLHEGSIRFTALDGRVRMLRPGETLVWPLAPDGIGLAPTLTPPEPEPPEPAPAPTVVSRPPHHRPTRVALAPTPIHYVDADDLLRQVDQLRSRGEFAEAVRYLTHGLTRELKPDTRERFSFELGIILTDQVQDHALACSHWKKHAGEFGAGRYGIEVSRASGRAHCEGAK